MAPKPTTPSRLDPADCSKMRFACAQCGAVYRVSLRLAGKLIRCRHCGSACHIPRGAAVERCDDARAVQLPPRVAHARYLDLLESRAVAKGEHPGESEAVVLPRIQRVDRLLIAANIGVLIAAVLVIVGLTRGPSSASAAPETTPARTADAGF